MFEMKKKRVRLTMEEKLWLVSHHEKNPKITHSKIGLDFSAKFKRPISRQCVCNIIQHKEEIKAFVEADPELEIKKTRNTHSITKVGVPKIELYELGSFKEKFFKRYNTFEYKLA